MPFSWPPQLVYPALVWLGLSGAGRWLATWCAAALCAFGLWRWLRTLRKARALRDTPVARIASAAQGYVEMHGRLKLFPGTALALPGNGLPCVWYRCTVEERGDRNWRAVDHFTSDESLLLDDGSGECLVFWEHAEWVGLRSSVTVRGDQRYTDTWLAPGDEVTVLGELRTHAAEDGVAAVDAEVGGLLDAWKRDRATLLRRFDRDGNGEIDLEEWECARRSARQTVMRERATQPARSDTHVLARPSSGRPFIIARLGSTGAARRLGLAAVVDAAAFLGGLWWLGRLLHGAWH